MEAMNKNPSPGWHSAAFFSDFDPEDLALLERIAVEVRASAGESIFELGDVADAIYILLEGTVTLTLPVTIRGAKTPVSIDTQEVGDLLGWSGLVPPYRRTLGARAVDDSRLVAFGRDELEPLFREHPQVHLAVKSKLCEVIARRLTLMEAVMLRDLEKWGSRFD